MDSNSSSDHEECSKSQRSPTINSKPSRGKVLVKYNKKGVPVGEGAKTLTTFEGMVARNMVPIVYVGWPDIGSDTKQELWEYVLEHFIVDPKSRKTVLQSIGSKWRNFKHHLYKSFITDHKDNPESENLLNPPPAYPSVTKEHWKVFVAQRLSKKWQMQETGMKEDEIDRSLLWIKARERKTGGFDSNVQDIVDRIDTLQKLESNVEVKYGQNDVLTQALGTEEQRGHVRGMGKFVTPSRYFFLPKTVKQYLDVEKKQVDQRFGLLEDEVDKLKRGLNYASEAGSCQMWGNEEFEDEPPDEACDHSCFLAVDVASNIVATGTIMGEMDENMKVMMECSLKGEFMLPIPLEDELIIQVKDGVGHILSWPRHLVIRVSDLVILFTHV
ncbi:uncharacterized protein LOC143557912 isoform X2 [Bidens hawaiensis]|uniref:uncharacterized protein LOC143557912 isoform X2 n=1 Tax=Bidens hawaiensis TaxID=980011 RepID=UPI004049B561